MTSFHWSVGKRSAAVFSEQLLWWQPVHWRSYSSHTSGSTKQVNAVSIMFTALLRALKSAWKGKVVGIIRGHFPHVHWFYEWTCVTDLHITILLWVEQQLETIVLVIVGSRSWWLSWWKARKSKSPININARVRTVATWPSAMNSSLLGADWMRTKVGLLGIKP